MQTTAYAKAGQVRAAASPTSLQLTLESQPLANAVDGYLKALTGAAAKPGVIGFAFAVDGWSTARTYTPPRLCSRPCG